MEGVKENAEGAEGVSEGGLEAKEKPEDAEPKGVDSPSEKADVAEVEQVVGTEKVNDEAEDDTGAVGPMLKGAAVKEAAGAGGVEEAAAVRLRFGNVAGADGTDEAILGRWVNEEPVNRNKNYFKLILTHAEQVFMSGKSDTSTATFQYPYYPS